MKYCSRDCQVAHHPNHKKLCWQRNAELFNVELFKDSPEGRECPICMLPLPFNYSQAYFYACCGKTLCVGCVYAQKKEVISKGKDKMVCAFCRTPPPKSEKEVIDRLKIGVERNDAKSMQQLAVHYLNGEMGLQKDLVKAIEMYQKAGKHGCASAYGKIGHFYYCDETFLCDTKLTCERVEKDYKKARQCWELAAIGGCTISRYALARLEMGNGNDVIASKHFLISAKAGCKKSLNQLKNCFKNGHITKDDYAGALRAYQTQCEDRKSATRDEALKSSYYAQN